MKKQAGYSHYWEMLPEESTGVVFTPSEWKKILAAARKIITQAERDGIAIRGPFGKGKPILKADRISLNGDADAGLDYETFNLVNAPQGMNFCKTGQRPYDKVVVSILAAAYRVNPEAIEVRSDGGSSAFSSSKIYRAASCTADVRNMMRAAHDFLASISTID